jgi:hypothetical protein
MKMDLGHCQLRKNEESGLLLHPTLTPMGKETGNLNFVGVIRSNL